MARWPRRTARAGEPDPGSVLPGRPRLDPRSAGQPEREWPVIRPARPVRRGAPGGVVRGRALRAAAPVEVEPAGTGALVPGDGWSAALAPHLGALDAVAVEALLAHLTAATGSRPTKAWSTRARSLLADPAVEAVLQALLLRLGDCAGAEAAAPEAVSEDNADLARAAVWAAAEVEASWVSPALLDVGRRGVDGGYPSERLLNAAAASLGRIADDDAVSGLQALALTARQSGQRAKLAGALEVAAERRGVPADSLLEPAVPTHGLDADGLVTLRSGRTRATVDLEDGGTLTVRWDGAAKPPAGAPAGEVAAVRRQVRSLRTAVTEEARRVERLVGTGRAWDDEPWSVSYLDHPLVSRVSRHVLWRFGDLAALPLGRTQVLGLHGPVPRPPGPVTLWDPADAPAGEAEAWTAALQERRVQQPFPQVLRDFTAPKHR